MSKHSDRTPVSSHTEYARSRVRCPDCGEYVTAGGAGEELCTNCV